MTSLDVENAASASPEGDPGDRALRRESHGRLLRALEELPPRQQEVLRLKFGEGLSYKEISRITRLSVSNVGYTIHVAVSRLRATLAADASQTREVSS
jgi:RNA polymerase sigma-70 factor (ECF subfamily)